jgi:hypothetical protein
MKPEEKLDYWADVGLFASYYIGRSLFGGFIRSVLGVPATPVLNAERQRPALANPILAKLAEHTRNSGSALFAKPTEKSPTAEKPGTLGARSASAAVPAQTQTPVPPRAVPLPLPPPTAADPDLRPFTPLRTMAPRDSSFAAVRDKAPEKSVAAAPEKSVAAAPEKSVAAAPEKSVAAAPEKSPERSPDRSPDRSPIRSPAKSPKKEPEEAPEQSPAKDPGIAMSKPRTQPSPAEEIVGYSALVHCLSQDHGKEFVVVELADRDVVLARMEVDNFPALVGATIITKTSYMWSSRWTMGSRDGQRIPLLEGRAVSEINLTKMTRKKALALSGDQERWVVRHVAFNSDVLQEIDPFWTKAGRVCLIVTRVLSVPLREPLVEGVVCQLVGRDTVPTIKSDIAEVTHVRFPFHSLVSLALNARVWADVEMRSDGPREIARIVPNFGVSESDLDRSLWGYTSALVGCKGLDVQLANGKKVDLMTVPLRENPWPKRPRKAPK